MVTTYVRAYLKRLGEEEWVHSNVRQKKRLSDYSIFIDTETSVDLLHNLKVGFYAVFRRNKIIIECGFFYVPDRCCKKEIKIIHSFGEKYRVQIMEHQKFIKEIFYKYTLTKKALCCFFNAPFDLARLAINGSFTKGERFHGGFSFTLTEDKAYPRIKIKANGSDYALIEFGSSVLNPHEDQYKGRFLDPHTLGWALSGEKDSLVSAGKRFDAKDKKQPAKEHGEITKKYLKYCARDVLSTFSAYQAMLEEYKAYGISLEPEKVYSSASIGKAVLREMNFKSFEEKNPSFSWIMKGKLMSAFYGGWCQVTYRKAPILCSVLDFTSMYPTVNTLLGLDSFLRAEKIEIIEDTENAQKFLDKIELKDINNKEIYKDMCYLCELVPDSDVLPVRLRFNQKKQTKNVGICEVISVKNFYYTLPDLLHSKIQTGKTPKIKRAWRFIPNGTQADIKEVEILGMKINPKTENIFARLVEERHRIKQKIKYVEEGTEEYNILSNRKEAIKLLINSTSYGIYVETNPKHKKTKINVFSNKFFTTEGVYEESGEFFNPIMGALITSTAHLLLGTAEVLLRENGHLFIYCDTDGFGVPPKAVPYLQNFFQELNPYHKDIPILKEEYSNVFFYGICAKRYVLYTLNGKEIKIVKYSLHGLGHLLNPFGEEEKKWHEVVWKDFLKLHYGWMTLHDFYAKYGSLYAVSKLSISNQELHKRIKKFNNSKDYVGQIKPFGFMLCGIGTKAINGRIVKPIAPYRKNAQEVPHLPFIDAETGETLCGVEYWRSLADILVEYLNHTEDKLEGDIGLLQRRKLHITDIEVCGKEAKNIEKQPYKVDQPTIYKKRVTGKEIPLLTKVERRKEGISRQKAYYWRKKQRTIHEQECHKINDKH